MYENIQEAILHFLLKKQRHEIPLLDLIEPEMFDNRQYRILFEMIKYKDYDQFEVKEKTKLSLVKQMDLTTEFFVSLSEVSVQEFIDQYHLEKVKENVKKSDSLTEVYSDISERMIQRIGQAENADVIREYEKFEKQFGRKEDGLIGLSTGWAGVDNVTLGLIPQHIWVVGGYYGSGKSYFGVNLANNVLERGGSVAIFSLEMSTNEYVQRLISLRSGLSNVEVIGTLGKEKNERRTVAKEEVLMLIDAEKLNIYDNAATVEGIRLKLKALKRKGVELVVIDYIQLLTGEGKQYEVIANNVTSLQRVARELGVTILLVSQISNQAQREGEGSSVDGFKGAGEIGQVANVAIRIYRRRDTITNLVTDDFELDFVKVRHNFGKKLFYKIKFPSGRIEK